MSSRPWLDPINSTITSFSSFHHKYLDSKNDLRPFREFILKEQGQNKSLGLIVQAILQSRNLAIYYNFLIAFVILSFGAIHWSRRLIRSHERRHRNSQQRKHFEILQSDNGQIRNEAITPSSSSSTLTGLVSAASPKLISQGDSERAPLLQNCPHKRRKNSEREQNSIFWNRLESWLMYQPKPIPYFNKVLPYNGLTLSILIFLATNIGFVIYHIPINRHIAFIVAVRCGNMFVGNLPLLYLLAAKNQPIKLLLGRSYESLNIFHRRLGEIMCFEALLHLVGMTVAWYNILRPLTGMSFWQYLFSRVVLLGLGAFFAYELIYFTSLGSFRQKFYEAFLLMHIFLQIFGLGFLWFHMPASKPDILIALCIFLLDRVILRTCLRTVSTTVALNVMEDGETVLVSANWDIPNVTLPFGRHLTVQTGWNPADHIFISIPILSRLHKLQAHPFTIYSAAPEFGSTSSHAWFNLLVRAKDGFSQDLLRLARTYNSAGARIDGPYGSSQALDLLESSDQAILVAGGCGIAVIFPLLWKLLCSPPDVESPSLNRSEKVVHLLWIVRDRSHLSWLPQERLDELKSKGLEVVIPTPTAISGRPEISEIIEDMVEVHSSLAERVGVVVSGPDAMTRDARNQCAALVGKGKQIKIVVEKFGW